MPFDLLLSEHGDLVFSAIRDFQGIAGVGQVNQRIRTRLKVPVGSWVYDENGTFGSQLHTLINSNPNEAQARAEAYVREALRPMDEISVDHVELDTSSGDMIVNVYYRFIGESSEFAESDFGTLILTIPLGG